MKEKKELKPDRWTALARFLTFFSPFLAGPYSRGVHYQGGLSAAQGDRKPNLWWRHSCGNTTADQSILVLLGWLFRKGPYDTNRAMPDTPSWFPRWKWFLCTRKMCHLSGKTERRERENWCRRIMINNRRHREAAHEGTKEGQTKEPVWVRSHLPAAFFKAPRREASILYYPSACLPSWRIFHLILVCQNRKLDLQMCPRPFPAVPQPLLFLIEFMRTTATIIWESGLAPLKSDWFYFHGEGRSSGRSIKFKDWVRLRETQRSAESWQPLGSVEVISLTHCVTMSTKIPPMSVGADY